MGGGDHDSWVVDPLPHNPGFFPELGVCLPLPHLLADPAVSVLYPPPH